MPKPTETQARARRYEQLKQIGLKAREASIATFPELPADAAPAHAEALPIPPTEYLSNWVTPRDLSREVSVPGMSQRLTTGGLPPDIANAMATSAVDSVAFSPDVAVDYDKLDAFETRLRERAANYVADTGLASEGLRADMQLGLTALGAVFGSAQQGWFSFTAGETMHDVLDRLWPDVDVRDDDDTQVRKAMVPYAIKAMGMRIGGQLLRNMNVGPHEEMIRKSREMGTEVAESMYDDLLTGQQVSEYNLMGYGAFANKLPTSGTPEREVYDKVIRDEVSQEFMGWKYQDGLRGKAAMFLFPVFSATRDILEDPLIVGAEAPKLLVQGLRAVVPASSAARVTGAIARRTGRVADLSAAINDAEKWMDKAGTTLVESPTKNNAARLIHAQKNIVRLKADLGAATQAAAEKVRMRVTPRIHPDHIKPVADVYLGSSKATRSALTKDFIRKQTTQATRDVKRLEKSLERSKKGTGSQIEMFSDEALGVDIPTTERQLAAAKQNRQEWVETRKWFNEKAANNRAGRTGAFLKAKTSTMGPYKSRVLYTGNDSSDVMSFLDRFLTKDVAPSKPPLKAMAGNGPPKNMRKATPPADRVAQAGDFMNLTADQAKARLAKLQEEADFLTESIAGLRKGGSTQYGIDEASRKLRITEDKIAVMEGWVESRSRAAKLLEGGGGSVVEPGDARKISLRRIHENIQRGIAHDAPEEEIIQWEHLFAEIAAGRRSPTNIMERPQVSAREIIAAQLDDARRTALSGDPTPVRAYGMEGDDPTQISQRMALGPDQAEATAEAARLLAAGADLDDVTFQGIGVELYNSSYGERLRPERSGEDLALADAWLGEDALHTKVETAQWQQTMAEKMSDKFAAALYPMTWNLRAPAMLQKIREPMRVLQSVNPKLYTRVHNAVHAQEYELMRMNELFSRELETLGIKVRVSSRGSGGSVGPEFVVNERRSKEFYELMNMDPTSDKYLDALSALPDNHVRAIRRIRQELDFIANKLGVAETGKYIEGYVQHVFDRRWFDGGSRPPEFGGLGANAEVYMAQLLTREGAEGYVPDLALALDTYSRAASRKLHMEPLIKDLETAAKAHLRATKGQDEFFVHYVNDMINNFKGTPTTLGHWVDREGAAARAHLKGWSVVESGTKSMGRVLERVGEATVASGERMGPGRLGKAIQAVGTQMFGQGEALASRGLPRYIAGDASRTAMGVSSLAYASVLSGNKRYFPMAVATGLATTGAKYGMFNTLHGIMAMATSEGRALAKTAGIDRQWLQIMETPAWKKASEAASKAWVFGPSIHATENLVRGWTFHAALGDLMRKQGLKHWDDVVEAGMANSFLHEAVRSSEEANHLFGQLGKPASWGRFSRAGSVMGTQFLSFMPKQTEELLAQTMSNPGYIGQYMMLSGALTRVGADIGVDLTEYVGFGYTPGKMTELQTIALETAGSLVAVTGDMGSHLLGSGDPVKTKRDTETMLRNLSNFVPLATAARQSARVANVLRTGKQFSGGSLTREVDLGQFEWDESKGLAGNIMNIPQGFAPKDGATGPTEMASVLSSMNSLQGRLERQQFNTMRSNALEKTYYVERLAEDLNEAARTGDNEAFTTTITKMIDEGIIPGDIAKMASNEALRLVVPRMLREEMRDTRNYINSVDSMQQLNAVYDMQFNQRR